LKYAKKDAGTIQSAGASSSATTVLIPITGALRHMGEFFVDAIFLQEVATK
jgi:hypothetical protein